MVGWAGLEAKDRGLVPGVREAVGDGVPIILVVMVFSLVYTHVKAHPIALCKYTDVMVSQRYSNELVKNLKI